MAKAKTIAQKGMADLDKAITLLIKVEHTLRDIYADKDEAIHDCVQLCSIAERSLDMLYSQLKRRHKRDGKVNG